MFTKEELKEIKNFISSSSLSSKIYIGTDSQKKKHGKTRYATVIVVHYNGNNGAKIFGTIDTEKDIKEAKNRPFNRMMKETYKTAEIYLELSNSIGKRYCEVHLDINEDENYGSHIALQSAVGYIKGVLGIIPITKPAEKSFAASCVADHWCKN